MAANNQITICGRLTRDPETRTVGNGDTVAGFAVAVNRPGKDKEADFFDVSVWGKSGQAAASMLTKGAWVAVSGRMTSRKHDGKTYWQIDANDWQFVGPKVSSDDGPPAPQTGERERIKAQAQAAGRWTKEADDDEIPPF